MIKKYFHDHVTTSIKNDCVLRILFEENRKEKKKWRGSYKDENELKQIYNRFLYVLIFFRGVKYLVV